MNNTHFIVCLSQVNEILRLLTREEFGTDIASNSSCYEITKIPMIA